MKVGIRRFDLAQDRLSVAGNCKKLKLVVCALCTTLLALCGSADAQQVAKVPRIGFMAAGGDSNHPDARVEAFRNALRDLGYIERKSILIEHRTFTESGQIPTLVAELVRLKVDLLVVGAQPAIRAAKQANRTIPIIIVTTQDPVAAGFIDKLARPGGNITGVTTLQRELSGKRLELLKEVLPGTGRVAALMNASSINDFKMYEAPARALKIQLQSLGVRGPNPDFPNAFQAAAKAHADALITVSNAALNRYAKRIADLAIQNRMPAMGERSDYVAAGGLISYSADDAASYRRAATYVDRY